MSKISIRFFNDTEVRAIWSAEKNTWYFSVVDIVGILSNSKNPRNYWKVLKSRLKKEKNELVTNCNQLKLIANDGKKYLTDCLEQKYIITLTENVPSKMSSSFIKWFTYNDETIDGKSKTKAYSMFDTSFINSIEVGTIKGLQQIHSYLFGGLYDFAGQIRTKNISKGGFSFAQAQFLQQTLKNIEEMFESSFEEIVAKYVEMNIAHPFMEGNGRSTRIWLDLLLKKNLKICIDWSKIKKYDYLDAMKKSVCDTTDIYNLLTNATTDMIDDREMFMKGIDYSYYYEEEVDIQ
ncbi:MAG: Fic family protein [Spirochaetales bacterium]